MKFETYESFLDFARKHNNKRVSVSFSYDEFHLHIDPESSYTLHYHDDRSNVILCNNDSLFNASAYLRVILDNTLNSVSTDDRYSILGERVIIR